MTRECRNIQECDNLWDNCAFAGKGTKNKIHYHTSTRTDYTPTFLLADKIQDHPLKTHRQLQDPVMPSGHTDTRLLAERHMINLGLASGSNERFFPLHSDRTACGVQPIQRLEEATRLRHEDDTHLILRVRPGMSGAIYPLPIYLHTMVIQSTQRHIYRQPRQYMPHRGTAMKSQCRNQGRAGEPFWGRGPKMSINSEEILSNAHGNFEDQNRVSEPSIIITNFCIITINA